ncbi:MAG TPA: aminoglycoside phosphotransferase family protein, partial [Acidimicrobiales bacterium]|nr:aminoglycoside phosphotransferase family protein [Acidimicrobiales bacterium]
MASFPLPSNLAAACRDDGRATWLAELPEEIEDIAARWSLTLGAPFEPGGVTAWVAPATSAELGAVVLKVGSRHMEGEDEAAGLREWNGDGAVRVFANERLNETTTASLLERCVPGTALAERPEEEQDVVIARLLRRLWRVPSDVAAFRPLQEMCDHWADGFERKLEQGLGNQIDPGLARAGAALFRALPSSAVDEQLLCTDLHAENVLASQREPWLVIDPKPFVGDPTYDALQHHLNCRARLVADPEALAA